MSIYELVSSEIYVSRLDNMYDIKSTDYIPRIPQYVAQALSRLDYVWGLVSTRKEIDIVDYKAQLPCFIEAIEAIEYKGVRLEKTDVINQKTATNNDKQTTLFDSYQVLSDKWISVPSIEEGTLVVYFKTLPIEKGCDGILFPKVPDIERLHEYIDAFILRLLLMRGYKHPILNLTDNNPITNVGIIVEKKIVGARNAIVPIDMDTRFAYSKILRAFIIDPNSYRTFHFNNTGE